MAQVVSVCISEKKGTKKHPVAEISLRPHHGIVGITLRTLPVGTVLRAGEVRLEVTQIGKECHNDCEIRRMTGMCAMPTDGIFAVVLNEGVIRPGDQIEVESI